MAARSASAAIRAYVDPLQRAITCFAPQVQFRRGGVDPAVGAEVLVTATGDPIPLRDASGAERAALHVRIHFRVEHVAGAPRRWAVSTVAYAYRLDGSPGHRQAIVGYHWHPHVPGIAFPHAHVYAAPPAIQRLHLPTGFITLKHVLTLAIRDLGVHAIREQWAQALDALHATMQESLRWASLLD